MNQNPPLTVAELEARDPVLAAQLRDAEAKAGVPAGTADRLLATIYGMVKKEVAA